MSNRVEPILNTPLDPLPKENIILPLNLRSTQYNSFPNMKTPKLQEIKGENLHFPALRNSVVLIKKKEIKPIKKPIEKPKKKSSNFLLILLLIAIIVFIIFIILRYII